MNVYSIQQSQKGEGKTLQQQTKIDLDHELYAIASNSIDTLALGGEENKVDTYNIVDGNITIDSLNAPFLAMQFTSRIQRLQQVGHHIIAIPENENEIQLFNTQSEKVIRF